MTVLEPQKRTYGKHDLPDGYQIVPQIRDLSESCARVGRFFPCALAARHVLWFESFRPKNETRRLFKRSVFARVRAPRKREPVDAVLFFSTRKAAWQPAIDRLGGALVKEGKRVEILSREIGEEGNGGALRTLIRLIRSFAAAAALTADLALRRSAQAKRLLSNPLNVWYELFESERRLDSVSAAMRQLKPRLVLTNGDHLPYAAEMLLTREAKAAKKIWFFNEYPDADMWPMLSDEAWLWNERCVGLFRSLPGFEEKAFRSIGKAELDFAGDAAPHASETELDARRRGRDAVVMLSEATGHPALAMDPLCAETLRWVARAAAARPDLLFIYKHRTLSGDRPVPGADIASGFENIYFADPSVPFARMLAWDFAKTFVATCSSGLFVAAALGKKAVRLRVSSRETPLPVIDAVSTIVDSPDGLVDALDAPAKSDFDAAYEFPFAGGTLARMTELCLAELSTPRGGRRAAPELPPPAARRGDRSDKGYLDETRVVRDWAVRLGGLTPDRAVLDVGCGDARLAYAMADYLSCEGRYAAFDVNAGTVARFRSAYAGDPRFRFDTVPVRHAYYNAGGTVEAKDFRFPHRDAAFDLVFVKSVFTHLLPPDVDRYLAEAARVLKPGGTMLATFFLLNAESKRLDAAGRSAQGLRGTLPSLLNHAAEGAATRDAGVPERFVAIDEAWLGERLAAHGLRAKKTEYGVWCGRETGLTEQDVLVAEKIR